MTTTRRQFLERLSAITITSTVTGTGTSVFSGGGKTSQLVAQVPWILMMGDSKTVYANNTWCRLLLASLGVTAYLNTAVAGYTLQMIVDDLPTFLPAGRADAPTILIDVGANETNAMPSQNTWVGNFQTLIDTAVARWPAVQFYIQKMWIRGRQTDYDTIAGWVDLVIASRPNSAFLGPDERIWMQGSDDGVTMSVDGTHYRNLGSPGVGQTECASQWFTVLHAQFGV